MKKSKRLSFRVDVDIDFQFWHLVPSININLHSHELEFEWLCLGIYAGRQYEPKYPQGLIDALCKDVKYCQDHILDKQ
ncbi:MAG: hypothetical protein II874_03985 [Bacteroidales bacterium]|nr:hypothetical protein [Bacteroidales bacterium]